MKIELQDINSVQPYDRNPRINDGAVRRSLLASRRKENVTAWNSTSYIVI
ncbi:MAG: hypothetical protein LBI05_10925 [Planctomycetaceae bacterium]|nr:hypothetical protein [Planctomycetaceae bacterium]